MASLLAAFDPGHEDIINDAVIDYYGYQMATCSSDNVVKIVNIRNATYSNVADLKGHYGPVLQVSWAHPKFGNILASCSHDRRVIVWKESTDKNVWTKMYEYKNQEGSVNTVSFGPSECGLTLACGSSDGSITILTLRTEVNMWETKKIANAHALGVTAVSWAPYNGLHTLFSQALVTSKPLKRFASAGCDCSIKIWREVNSHWTEMVKLNKHCDWIRDVTWAQCFSVPFTKIASASEDKKVIIWNSNDDFLWIAHELPPFEEVVRNVSWSLTANLLAVSDGTNKVTIWKEIAEGEWCCVTQVCGSDRFNNVISWSLDVAPKKVPEGSRSTLFHNLWKHDIQKDIRRIHLTFIKNQLDYLNFSVCLSKPKQTLDNS